MAGPVGGTSRRREVAEALLDWWGVNRRDFPWRQWTDPYHLLVSEILLRQTRAETVGRFVEGFLETFPTPHQLRTASDDELASILRPLGFSRQRARQLGGLAAVLDAEKPFDLSHAALDGLPGIGRYSAAMVEAVNGGKVAAVDTNVARVVCRVFAVVPSHAEARKSANVWAEAEGLVAAADDAAIHVTWALLDLAANVCRQRRPRCSDCPLWPRCAYAQKQAGVALAGHP
jgi:A/G-specific adenine glycosylase